MELQENPSNEIRDTLKKIICSASRMPFITDWSQPNLHVKEHMHTEG